MGLMLIVLSAALFTAGFYNSQLYLLTWFAMLPFLYYLFVINRDDLGYKKIFYSGWGLGFFILLFSGNFLYHSIKLYTAAPFFIIMILLFLIFLLLALIYGFLMVFYLYLQKQLKSNFNPYLFSFIWLFLELGRYYLLGFFPIANPAYTQIKFLNFIQLVDLGGIWILTFVLILVNSLLFQLIFYQKKYNLFVLLTIFIIIFGYGQYSQKIVFSAAQAKTDNFKVGIISTEIEQETKWSSEQLDKNIEILKKSASNLNKSDLIIAPETNLTFDFKNNYSLKKEISAEINNKFTAAVQIGSLAGKENYQGRFNSTFLISDQGKIIQRYDKNLLLYFGETYPYLDLLNKILPFSFSSLNAGIENEIFKYEDLGWKTIICSEILYPDYVKIEEKSVDFIVNQTNEAWFKNTKLLKNIMWQAAVIRAVENRLPVIKTGNQAHNGIIYPNGKYKQVDSDIYHQLELNY